MKQSVLVKIRGNKAYDHIKKLFDMGLVNKKRMGHTAELTLTDSFHEYFNVEEGNNESASHDVEKDILEKKSLNEETIPGEK
jgi:segregation and condensation protein B